MQSSMTSFQRMKNRLSGLPVDRPPNFDIIMTYGVGHINARLRDYYLDYRTLVRMNLAVVEDFGLDIVQVISDPYREACDWGLDVDFPPDYLPMRKAPRITAPEEIRNLRRPDPSSSPRMKDRLEAVRMLKQQVGGEVPVMGWVEGALAEANDLRGDSDLLTDLYDRPEWLHDLLEMLTEIEIEFARLQVQAGADIIGLGDAIASTISPKMYREFALPYEQRIFAEVRRLGAVPRLHICGNTTMILADMAQSGAAIIDLDWMVNLADAAALFSRTPGSPAACGNFDPVRVMLFGSPEDVYNAVIHNLTGGGPTCISAAGCEIPVDTPVENIQAQNRALRDFQTLNLQRA